MILEIALGIVLGFLILNNLRGVVAMSAFAVMFFGFLAALGAIGWLLFEAAVIAKDAVEAVPPLPESVTDVITLVLSLGANVLFMLALGEVIERRCKLRAGEARVFGAVFYVLLVFTAITAPIALLGQILEARIMTGPLLYLLALSGVWAFALRQLRLRKRARAQECPAEQLPIETSKENPTFTHDTRA